MTVRIGQRGLYFKDWICRMYALKCIQKWVALTGQPLCDFSPTLYEAVMELYRKDTEEKNIAIAKALLDGETEFDESDESDES